MKMGLLRSDAPWTISVEEAAEGWTRGDGLDVRIGHCSRYVLDLDQALLLIARYRFYTIPKRAAELGWRPANKDEDWETWIVESFKLVSANAKRR